MARRKPLRILQSILYHSSFAFLVLVTLVAVTGSAWGLISQARFTGGQSRWNIVILVAGYGAVLFVSFFVCVGRILNIRYTLQTIPRPYVPIKEADLEPKLSRYITSEYTRTSIIAHVQQPTAGEQEGWGAPRSTFPSLHYQTFLLQKLHAINALLPPIPAAPPIPISPHKIRTLPLFYHPLLNTNLTEPLARIVDVAQYSGRELTEGEAEKGVKILWAVQTIINQSTAATTTSSATHSPPQPSAPKPHPPPPAQPNARSPPPPPPPNVSPIDFAVSPTSTNRHLQYQNHHHPEGEKTVGSGWTGRSMSESESFTPLIARS